MHVGCGEISIAPAGGDSRCGIVVVARDEGPGIADVETAMQPGYGTRGGLGLGLPGARRLMDEFSVDSTGEGTTVTMSKWRDRDELERLRENPKRQRLTWTAAAFSSGASLRRRFPASRRGRRRGRRRARRKVLVGAVDGLGHGEDATLAADAAAAALRTSAASR